MPGTSSPCPSPTWRPPAGLSPAHFSRQFKRTFGESPHQYLLTRRLERAAALLRTTYWTVAAICFAVGAQGVGSSPGTSPGCPGVRAGEEWRAACRACLYRHGSYPVSVRTAFKCRAYPDADQQVMLNRTFGCVRVVWNRTLAARHARYAAEGTSTSYAQADAALLMPVPGPPMLDAEGSAQLAELVAKGAGGTLFLETDDCQAAYDDLSARGVMFSDPPTAQAYGIDTSFRDPSGNNIRLTQVLEFDPKRG